MRSQAKNSKLSKRRDLHYCFGERGGPQCDTATRSTLEEGYGTDARERLRLAASRIEPPTRPLHCVPEYPAEPPVTGEEITISV